MQVCLDPEDLTVGELRGSGDFHQWRGKSELPCGLKCPPRDFHRHPTLAETSQLPSKTPSQTTAKET